MLFLCVYTNNHQKLRIHTNFAITLLATHKTPHRLSFICKEESYVQTTTEDFYKSDFIGYLLGHSEMRVYVVRISINGIQFQKGAFLQVYL